MTKKAMEQNNKPKNLQQKSYRPPKLVRVRVSTTGSMANTGKQYADSNCTQHYHDTHIDCAW